MALRARARACREAAEGCPDALDRETLLVIADELEERADQILGVTEKPQDIG